MSTATTPTPPDVRSDVDLTDPPEQPGPAMRRPGLFGRLRRRAETETSAEEDRRDRTRTVDPVDIPANDPLLVYLTSARRPVAVDDLELESPAVTLLRDAGVRMLVPLVTNGELVGVVQLGDRLSEQDYSTDDRRLLEQLAGQAAPALRVGQLVRTQQAEARVRERYEQELAVAQLIQQRFLPHDLPEPAGWRIHPYYRAAREVGGDFYDVLDLPDGRLGLVIGDVTDKGVPAALVMASTRSVLRAAAQRLVDPVEVLTRVNDELVGDIPSRMFVTCLYGVLDPATGEFEFANAGHDLPFVELDGEVEELQARGMPLGMLPGSDYTSVTTQLRPGSRLLLYSDGIAEAHAVDGEMFGFERTGGLLVDLPSTDPVDALLDRLATFTGSGWEQEDDVTVVLVERAAVPVGGTDDATAQPAATFALPSEPGGEREAIRLLREALADVDLPAARLDALSTATGEAVMNAMEHGHRHDASLEVVVTVTTLDDRITVDVTDHGGGDDVVDAAAEPDIDAKLRGEQTPRGWGLFLVRSLVDEVHESTDGDHHTLTLELLIGGGA